MKNLKTMNYLKTMMKSPTITKWMKKNKKTPIVILFFISVILIITSIVLAFWGYVLLGENSDNETFLTIGETNNFSKFNITLVDQSALKELEKYYNTKEFGELKINHYSGKFRSKASTWIRPLGSITVIKMEINSRKDRNWYYAILSHELSHYALYNIGLYDAKEGKGAGFIDEAIAQTYNFFVLGDKNTFERYFGSSYKSSEPEYYLILSQLKEKDNFECLKEVWNEDKKIRDYEDLKDRLIINCGVDWQVFKNG